MVREGRISSSFRDPSGHLFVRDGTLYRQVNQAYRRHYDRLVESGLYDRLVDAGKLVAHEPADTDLADSEEVYKVVRPVPVPFISYPYEWCFSQLKDAALLTLEIQKTAMDHGMSLKDASAYNVQFLGGSPILIDTLSFEVLSEGEPWVAYRQFCQHFLAPLALMAYLDVRLSRLLGIHIDGVPIDLASRLLPARTRLHPGLLTHVHLHARAQKRFAGRTAKPSRKMPRSALLGIIDGLQSTVRRLRWKVTETEWGDYYEDTNYSPDAMRHKAEIVSAFLDEIRPRTVWDLGANTGVFSQLAAERGATTVAFDVDPGAVERNYLSCKSAGARAPLPLLLDLTNPSPAIGWENTERMSFLERGPVDLVMALALVHHLAISNNVPLERLAEFFARTCDQLIVEFVPKEDSQVQRLLATREDVFHHYDQASFEERFGERFDVESSVPVPGSKRSLYHLRRKA